MASEPMSSEAITFSPGETKLFLVCFKDMKSAPDIDFEKVAEELNYKTVAVARANFNRAWRKHFQSVDNTSTDTLSPTKASPTKAETKAKVTKRKATNDTKQESPKRKRATKALKVAESLRTVEDDETNVKEEVESNNEDEDGQDAVKVPKLTTPNSSNCDTEEEEC